MIFWGTKHIEKKLGRAEPMSHLRKRIEIEYNNGKHADRDDRARRLRSFALDSSRKSMIAKAAPENSAMAASADRFRRAEG